MPTNKILFAPTQDIMTKIKAVLIDEKKHIRFSEWTGADVSYKNFPAKI